MVAVNLGLWKKNYVNELQLRTRIYEEVYDVDEVVKLRNGVSVGGIALLVVMNISCIC